SVGSDNVDLIAKGSGPGADCVTGSGSVPGSAGGVLHFLRSQLTNNIGGAVYFDGTVFNDGGGAVGVGADRGGIDGAVCRLNAGAQSSADAAGTGDGVVVADITDGQNVADDAVAVAVDGVDVCLDVLFDHGALQLGALGCVGTYIVGVRVRAQSGPVQFGGGAVGGLAA